MSSREPEPATTDLAIIGGGPAGLTAAYEYQNGADATAPIVFEASEHLGGIARTESPTVFGSTSAVTGFSPRWPRSNSCGTT